MSKRKPASMMYSLCRAQTAAEWLHQSTSRDCFTEDTFHPGKADLLRADLVLAREVVRGLEMAIKAHDEVYKA